WGTKFSRRFHAPVAGLSNTGDQSMKKPVIAALAAFVHAGVLCSHAADAPDNNNENRTTDEAVVITVTKHAEAESKLGSAFSRIDSDEISRTQFVDLKESVNTTPGVFASESGG